MPHLARNVPAMTTPIDPEAVAIGRAVRGALATAGVTIGDASEQTGIALSTLSRRINGSIPFTFPELVKVAALCNIRVSDLAAAAERSAGRAA